MSKIKTVRRRATVVVGAMTLAASVFSIPVMSSPAMAASVSCSHHKTTDKGTWNGGLRGSVAFHTGPYGACKVVGHHADDISIYCQTTNDYGNIWYYAKDDSSGKKGWIYQGNVRWTFGGEWGC